MDPCPFVKLIIESLSLKIPLPSKPCFCKIKLKNFPSQNTLLPFCFTIGDSSPDSNSSSQGFHLDPSFLRRLAGKSVTIVLSVYSGKLGSTCGIMVGKILGRVTFSIDLEGAETKARVFQNGWVKLGHDLDKPLGKLHLVVRSEPDPRFVFQFGGEPECSPVVFQIQENIQQPVFSCKFSADRNWRSRSLDSNFTTNSTNRGWIRNFSREKEKQVRQRKGWMIMIHDLSGSPVAAASMITPFVASPGSDRVSRSNPGAWLILRPNGFSAISSWKAWGRLEAWREKGPVDGLGYKFELVTDNYGPNSGIPLAEATLSVKNGGQFCIDSSILMRDSGFNSWSSPVKGFVMGSSVEGEGKVSKPLVQVGVQHVTCMADAALFIALSAAIDLSMDACRLFPHKLRKELCYDEEESSY